MLFVALRLEKGQKPGIFSFVSHTHNMKQANIPFNQGSGFFLITDVQKNMILLLTVYLGITLFHPMKLAVS